MSKQCSHPSGKALVIILVIGAVGVLLVGGAGAVALFNWEKLGLPTLSGLKAESAQKLAESQAVSTDSSAPPRRPVVASAPLHAHSPAVYQQYMERDDVLVMVDYYADWCPPCRAIAPVLSTLAAQHGDKVVILKVNVDSQKQLASRAGVRSIPDVRLFHRGQQLEKVIGGNSYDRYESLVLKHESRLPAPGANAKPQATQAPSRPVSKNGNGTSIVPLKDDWTPPGVTPAP